MVNNIPAIDMRSIMLGGIFIVLICTLLVEELWRQNRRRFDGLALLAADFALQTIAMVFIMQRGSIPDWISILVSNTFLVAGALLGYEGLERFVGKRGRLRTKGLLLLVFVLIHAYFTFFDDRLQPRNFNVAVAILIICLQTIWLLMVRVDPVRRPLTRMVAGVYIFYAMTFFYRIIYLLVRPVLTNDYLHSGSVEAGFHIIWQVQFVLLTYAIALMVNRRLVMRLVSQEEKFSKAFHSSPYAIIITQWESGKILEVNDGFERITGFTHEDIIGKTTFELDVWVNINDRQNVVNILKKRGSVSGLEMSFRRKSGEIMTGLFSAETIVLGGEACILSSINDISERKKTEKERELLLQEKEKVLSEIKVLSGLLPICAWCKKIRDDQGYWNQLESYIDKHSEAEFSHGICPDCMKKEHKKE